MRGAAPRGTIGAMEVLRIRRALVPASLLVLAALVAGAPASADRGDDGDTLRAHGTCTGSSATELRVRAEEGRLEIEFRVDAVPRGRAWTVVVLRERRIAFRGVLRPRGSSRSVELRRTVVDWPGAERVLVRAVARDGEACRASVIA